jgi:hypothetical protein
MPHRNKMTKRGKKLYQNTHGTVYKVRVRKVNPAIQHLKDIRISNPVKTA